MRRLIEKTSGSGCTCSNNGGGIVMPHLDMNVNRRRFIGLSGALLLSTIGLSFPKSAHATSTGSGTYYLAGHTVTCVASITASSSRVDGNAQTILLGSTAPSLGAYVVIYNDSGASVASNIEYSNGPAGHKYTYVSATASPGRSYRSFAVSYVFNNSTGSYDSNFFEPVWSPFETAYALDNAVYQQNSSGLTYGPITGLRVYGYLPDLILVEGVGGNAGYVKQNDFIPPVASNPEDAALRFSNPQIKTVPVFDAEGLNQLDTYEVHYGG